MNKPNKLLSGEVAARLARPTGAMQVSERRVMDVILEQPERVVDSSVSEVAALAGTATSTVVRTCKTAGFRGFHELKLKLVSDLAVNPPERLSHAEGLTARTKPAELLGQVMQLSARAIETAATTLDPAGFAKAVTKLATADRILAVGNGTSMAPAQDAAYRFLVLGLNAVAPPDSYSQDVIARQLGRADVCLVISHTGATRDSLETARTAKDAGAFVIVISSYSRSPATEIADVVLVAGGHEQGFRLETMSSRLCHLAVVDALFVGIALTEPRRATKNLDLMAEVTADHSY